MENKSLEPMDPLDDADVQALWPRAELNPETRDRLVEHAAALSEMPAIQDVFDASAVQLDELSRRRLLQGIVRRPNSRPGWPWQQAWVAAAATFLAVLAAGQWPGVAKDPVRLDGGSLGQATAKAEGGVEAQARHSSDSLDESAELAAALPGLEGAGDGEESARDEDDDGNDLDSALDALHGLAAEDSPEAEAI